MYSFKSRVSYSEVDHTGRLSIPAIVNYFQDCALFHSQDVGLDLDFLKSHHRAWLLSSWQLIFNDFPAMGEPLTITTWPYSFKRLYGFRNLTLKDSHNQVVAYANSDWFYYDSESGRPICPEPNEYEPYGLDEKLDMDYKPRKIKFPADMNFIGKVLITPTFIDTNHHVNNGEYVRVACGYLPIDYPVHALRVEYRLAAKLGQTFHVYTKEVDQYFYITLCDEDQNPYTIMEFERKE